MPRRKLKITKKEAKMHGIDYNIINGCTAFSLKDDTWGCNRCCQFCGCYEADYINYMHETSQLPMKEGK